MRKQLYTFVLISFLSISIILNIPEECCKQAIALNKQKYTFIKNTISVVADDLGEAGYRHSTPTKKEPVRGGYVMPPEASSIDTLLSRSKALADQMREEIDE